MKLRSISGTIMAASAMMVLSVALGWSQSKDLKASIAQIPGLADSPEKGIVRRPREGDRFRLPGWKDLHRSLPFQEIHTERDGWKLGLPHSDLRERRPPASSRPYSWVPEKMGSFSLVIYSNKDKPLTKKDLDAALAKGGKFPYTVEVAGGLESNYPFPVVSSNDTAQSLKKVQMGRVDATIWGTEADELLKSLKLNAINRARYADFDDVIVVAKSPRGDQVKKILTDAMAKLRASGKLQEIYGKIHRPYEDWQPSQMGW